MIHWKFSFPTLIYIYFRILIFLLTFLPHCWLLIYVAIFLICFDNNIIFHITDLLFQILGWIHLLICTLLQIKSLAIFTSKLFQISHGILMPVSSSLIAEEFCCFGEIFFLCVCCNTCLSWVGCLLWFYLEILEQRKNTVIKGTTLKPTQYRDTLKIDLIHH